MIFSIQFLLTFFKLINSLCVYCTRHFHLQTDMDRGQVSKRPDKPSWATCHHLRVVIRYYGVYTVGLKHNNVPVSSCLSAAKAIKVFTSEGKKSKVSPEGLR